MTSDYPLSFKGFKSIYSKVPRLCVDLIVKNDKGILFTLRSDNGWQGQWHLPGGTVYFREPAKNAAKRVAKNELGIDITVQKFLGYIEYFSEEKERGFGYTVSLVFLCKPKTSKFTLNNQASKAEFFKTPPTDTIIEQKEFLKNW